MQSKSLRPGFLSLLLVLAACSEAGGAREVFPRPTEDILDAGAEARQKTRRKAWFEHRHQAAPDVDWRALERENGEAQIEKRNRLGREALLGSSPWVERGSENLAGRVHGAALAPDGQSLYCGTSLGGIWRGSLDGLDWEPLGDNLYGGSHHLAAVSGENPGDPDVLLVATDGGLFHVTRDDGATWEIPAGMGSASAVRRVLKASDGSEAIFVLRQRSGTYKLMRSVDRMATFTTVFDFGSFAGDAWMHRDGSSDLYVLHSDGAHRSVDLGANWVDVGPAPIGGSSARLTGSEAGAPRLWSVVPSGGQEKLHRSDDAGASWSFVADIGDFWGELCGSILSADLFVYGGVEAHRTQDGGGSFAVINTWQAYYGNPAARLHADIMGIDVALDPAGTSETWYISTDGGLYRSANLVSVQSLSTSGLRVSQYYSTHTSSANPLHVVAGAQDQGYQRAVAPPLPPMTTLGFSQLISGDYGHLTTGDGDHDYLFSVYPGFVLIQVGENSPSLVTEDFPAGEDHAWMPPVVADPLDPRQFFLCASRIYRYVKAGGNNWNAGLWSTFDFGLAAGEYVSALVFSPVDPQRAYAVTDRGRLYHSGDRGVSWTQSTSNGPSGQYFYGTALLASSLDVDTVYVGGSGYSGPAIRRSVDGGVSFQDFSTGLPPTLVYCLGESPDASGTLFCGTETAAYRRDAGGASWADITGTQAPVTIYWSVEALPNENTLRFGTYGRGIWDYQLELQASALVRNGSGVNPLCLTSISLPELGGTWSVAVDSSPLPGATTSYLLVKELPASGPLLGFGEVLVGGTKYLTVGQPASGVDVFSFPVPNDVGLLGTPASSQGMLFGGGRQLCNALDVVVGY